MQVSAVACGLPLAEFWAMTPREFSIFAKGTEQRRREDMNMLIATAHLTASLERQKRMPKLKKLLIKDSKDQAPKTQEELEAKIHGAMGVFA